MDDLEQRTGRNEPQRYSYKKPKEGFFRRHMLLTYLVATPIFLGSIAWGTGYLMNRVLGNERNNLKTEQISEEERAKYEEVELKDLLSTQKIIIGKKFCYG